MAIINTIKKWLFSTLFRDKGELITVLREEKAYWELKYTDIEDALKAAHKYVDDLRSERDQTNHMPKSTLADLMRENLGLVPIDFSGVSKEGLPQHPFDAPKQIRDHRIAQIASLHNNDSFQLLCKYLIDVQGNYSMRNALTWEQDMFGRASINGISVVMAEISKAQALYEEANSPPDDYDEHEII